MNCSEDENGDDLLKKNPLFSNSKLVKRNALWYVLANPTSINIH